jgi:hypothetical protein
VLWVAWYSGDAALIAEAYDNVARYLTGGATGFVYHEPSQTTWGRWTIAPVGTTNGGFDLDGAIHDLYRGGPCCARVGADGQNYTWEAMQGIVSMAIAADMAGHTEVWSEGDSAIRRAYDWLLRTPGVGPPTGDDTWIPYVMREAYGRAASGATIAGKGFGYTDWRTDFTIPPGNGGAAATALRLGGEFLASSGPVLTWVALLLIFALNLPWRSTERRGASKRDRRRVSAVATVEREAPATRPRKTERPPKDETWDAYRRAMADPASHDAAEVAARAWLESVDRNERWG